MTPTTGFVDDSSSAVSHSSLTAAGGFFLSLLVTLIVVCAALVNLVKHTASKYLRNPLRFQEGGDKIKSHIEGSAVSSPMLDQQEVHQCAVCAKPASKRCSRCKTTRYCSSECQTKHWTESHKLICKATSGSKKKGFDLAGSFGRSKNIDSPSKVSSNGTQMAACNGNIVLPKPQVLFPYESFIELFNWNKLRLVPCGLINCGNSCFANVVLQCLTCTRPLVAFLLESYHTESCRRMDWCFLCELYKHVRRVAQCDEPFSPLEILSRISKMGGSLGYGRQEDAHEFMRVAIDSMQSICLDEFGGEKAVHPSSRETTVIYHIFGGHLQSQVVCMQCSRVSNRYENMMDLTVEIHGDVASLEDALEQFTAREWLDGENKYKCDGCNAYVKACKRLTVHQPPNVLTVALKRFQTGRFGKLNKRVTFPETLDLSPYMSGVGMESQIYKLYAVVVHVDMLNASFFGHYICFVKDLHGSWYRVDDCKVKRVDLEEVLSQNAYMLLYSRIAARSPCTSVSLPCSSTKSIDECKNINPIIHSPSSSSSNSTDEYLSSPFEVVESLRSSLDGNSPNACGDDNGPVHKTSAGSIEKHVHSPASVALSSNASNVESVHEYIALKDPEPSACMSNSLEGQIQKLGKQEKQEASLNLFASKRKLQRCSSCPVLFSENIPDICQRETSVLVDRLAGLVFKSLKESNGIEISECSSLAGPLAGTCKQGILTKQNGSSKCIMNLVTHKNMDVDSELAHPSSDNERNKMLVCDGVMTKPSQEILLSNPSACFLDDTQNNNSSLDGCIFEPTLESGVLHRNTTEICMMDEDHTSRDQDIAGDEIRHANLEKHDFCNMQQVDMESLETEADATDDSSQKLDSHCSSMVSALNSAKPHLLSMPRNEGCHSEHNMLLENEENSPGVCRMSIVDTVFTDYPSNEFSLNNGQSMVIQAKKSEEIKPTVTPGFLQSPSQNLESKKALLKVDGSHSFVSQNPLQASLTFSENVDPVTSVTSKHAFDSNGNCNVPIQPFSSNKSVLSDTIDFLSTKENPVPKSHEMSDKSSNSVAEGREMRSFHSSGMTERKLVNKPKEKPLFPQGFLNGVPRAKAPKQAELSPKNTLTGIHSVAGIDAAVAESRLVTCRVHNSDCSFPSQSNRLSTDTLLKNVSPDKIGNGSVSDDKQVLCHGVKRALRAESLHKDKEISDDAMRAKRVPRQQKQGRNERCACGSQRKWKHCCGKLDLIRNVSVR